MTNSIDPHEFEDNVRRIGRELWPTAEYDGAAMIDGKERDGIFRTEFAVHVLECTTQTTKAKAEQDISKIIGLILQQEKCAPSYPYTGWFITYSEPTADQRKIADDLKKRHPSIRINILSYDQFAAKLINIQKYLDCRNRYKFGSIADPETGNIVHDPDYIHLGITVKDKLEPLHTKEIVAQLLVGDRFILLGDYGAGKSMTLKQLHKELQTQHFKHGNKHFPIFLNLRDHQNQTNPVEALHRHAELIGFPFPDQLVRAWRAGYAIVLLDGFDEIARAGWSNQLSQLRNARHEASELVRRFITETPLSAGLVIAGRDHFFDKQDEMIAALGISPEFTTLTLSEFTNEQIAQYLKRQGWNKQVPEWIPARPLLLGYLASKKLLMETLDAETLYSPATAWDMLLDRISEREAKIDSGINGASVRRIIERLATFTRKYRDGIGPLTREDISHAFKDICFREPDDSGLSLLQRLPGLGAITAEDGTRQFIDITLADVARAGDIIRFIRAPYNTNFDDSQSWQCLLGEMGLAVATSHTKQDNIKPALMTTAIEHASLHRDSILIADIVMISHEANISLPESTIVIKDVLFQSLDINPDGTNMGNIEFRECLIGDLNLPAELPQDKIPNFVNCIIHTISDRVGRKDIPSNKFVNTDITNFTQSVSTTSNIMHLKMPLQVNVMLTILKKVYIQKGAGRMESALYRGLDAQAKAYVPIIIDLLVKQGILVRMGSRGDAVWHSVREQVPRIRHLLSSPTNQDQLIAEASKL